MKTIEVNLRKEHFFWAFWIVTFFTFGISTLQAATLPTQDSSAPDDTTAHKKVSQGNDWALWLKEGNAQTFTLELEKITQCVKGEKVDVDHLPANVVDMTSCQKQVWDAVTYRDSDQHNLLQTYLKYSKPDLPGDPSYLHVIGEAMAVINGFLKLGMTLVDWENERASSDNLFFLAIKYNKLGLLNQLLAGIKKFDEKKIPKLAKMRSGKNDSLADALIEKQPDNMAVLYMIIQYHLVDRVELLKHKSGQVYEMLAILQRSTNKEL